MKYKYIMVLLITSFISLSFVFLLIREGAQTLNTNFILDTIRGDELVLNNFEISSTIRLKEDVYYRVALNEEGTSSERLNNEIDKKLMRGIFQPTIWETEEHLIVSSFDSKRNIYKINIKNKETQQVVRLEHDFSDIKNIQQFQLVKTQEKKYIIIQHLTENNGLSDFLISIFSLDFESFVIEKEFTYNFESPEYSNMLVASQFELIDQTLYLLTGSDELGNRYFISLNLETREEDYVFINFNPSAVFLSAGESSYLFLRSFDRVYYVFNTATSEWDELEQPSFLKYIDTVESQVYAQATSFKDYGITTYAIRNQNNVVPYKQFIAIYDLQTLDIIYEGQITIESNQGIISDFELSIKEN